jgi:HK97 family phage prohead protease
MQNRAMIDLSIKSVDDDARQIEGWASRVEEDRMGDVVVPDGAVYKLPLPFLLDHDHTKSVGLVDKVEVTPKGIKFWAHIKKISEEGEAKRLTDYAWSLIKHGLRSAVSIGFRSLDAEQIPNSYGLKFKKWEWLELSAVTVPAHPGATITARKSLGGHFVTVPQTEIDGTVKLIRARDEHIRRGAVPLD